MARPDAEPAPTPTAPEGAASAAGYSSTGLSPWTVAGGDLDAEFPIGLTVPGTSLTRDTSSEHAPPAFGLATRTQARGRASTTAAVPFLGTGTDTHPGTAPGGTSETHRVRHARLSRTRGRGRGPLAQGGVEADAKGSFTRHAEQRNVSPAQRGRIVVPCPFGTVTGPPGGRAALACDDAHSLEPDQPGRVAPFHSRSTPGAASACPLLAIESVAAFGEDVLVVGDAGGGRGDGPVRACGGRG